ncbi:MAG: acyl-CoA dehydratase activase [Gammaproteobacteria bacterium]|nr:acyl-CoA dehydratase activase [Gammaproteobacteria bacterium]
MPYFAGIDIGSTAIKVVLVDEADNLFASKTVATGSHFYGNAQAAFLSLLKESGLESGDIGFLTATGYGRKLYREADESVSEITANAMGAKKVGEAYGGIRTIINIGGQDSKAIQIDREGNVVNFAMNDKCAAGTGRFLDMAARNLELELDELGDYHFNLKGAPPVINSTCAVFAESEVIGLLASGYSKEEIVAGIHFSIAKRTVRLVKRIGLEDQIYFDGGPALNKGLVAAFEEELMRKLVIPDIPQITTAYGAAILAREAWQAEELAAEQH